MHGARMDDGPNGSTLVISLGESWQWFWHASPMFWTRHIVSYWRALIDKMTGMLCVGCCWIAWSFGCRDRLLDVFLFWLTWNLLQVVELEQVKVCLKAICLFENVGVRPNWLERNQVSHVLIKIPRINLSRGKQMNNYLWYKKTTGEFIWNIVGGGEHVLCIRWIIWGCDICSCNGWSGWI